MENIVITSDLNFEKVWLGFQEVREMFRETDKRFQETDKKFLETDKKFLETDKKFLETERMIKESDKLLTEKFLDTDRRWKEIQDELGGIGKSNGAIAEEFFYSALENSLQIGKLKFDYIDRNLHRKRNKTEGEFDIILYNAYKVVVVEIKYNFRMDYLRRFYEEKLKRFRTLFPEYKEYKLYGAIAALTFEKGVINEAENFGFYILSQNNDKVKIVNPKNFEPNEIK